MKHIFEIMLKRKKAIIGFTVAGCLFGAAFSLAIRPTYEATVELVVEPRDTSSNFSSDADSVREYVNHQIDLMKSEPIVKDVIDKLHLGLSDILNQKDPQGSLLKYIKIRKVGKVLIKITAHAKTPQLATSIASQFANSYLELNQEESFTLSKAATKWLSETSSIAKEIKKLDNEVLDFVKQTDIIAPDKKIESYQYLVEELLKEKEEISSILTTNKKALVKIEEMSRVNLHGAIMEGLDPAISTFLGIEAADYKGIQYEIDNLLLTYKPDHPKIVELNIRKQAILASASSKIKESKLKLENEINRVETRIAEIDKEVEAYKTEYAEILEKKKDYDSIKYKIDNLTQLYDEAIKQLKSGNLSLINVSILGFTEKSSAPVKKVQPIRFFLIVFSSAGFIIGYFVSYFLEQSSMQKKTPPKPLEDNT